MFSYAGVRSCWDLFLSNRENLNIQIGRNFIGGVILVKSDMTSLGVNIKRKLALWYLILVQQMIG